MRFPFLKNRYSSSEKEGIRINSRMATFFICVLISIFFWLMMSLSKEYNITVNVSVDYINPPKDKVVVNALPDAVNIDIRSSGFNLLLYKIKQHRKTVQIDIKDSKPLSKNHRYLYTSSRLDKITAQFKNEIRVLKIEPDTIIFDFTKKVSRKVPVKNNLTINFDDNYQQRDSIKLTPEFITVSGAADDIAKIDYVETEPVNLNNVEKSLSLKLPIVITPDLKLLELSQSDVEATVNVAKYTEGSVELPVEVENLPAGYSLKTFPDKVTVKYNVAFDDYENINPIQFKVVVDYNKIESGSNKLKVHLVKYPPEVRAIKLSTEKVEYIIRK